MKFLWNFLKLKKSEGFCHSFYILHSTFGRGDNMEELFNVGKIVNTHALKGEVKVMV